MESVVRKFLAAFTDRNVDELIGFFSDDAVFIDGPRGSSTRGKEAIGPNSRPSLRWDSRASRST